MPCVLIHGVDACNASKCTWDPVKLEFLVIDGAYSNRNITKTLVTNFQTQFANMVWNV